MNSCVWSYLRHIGLHAATDKSTTLSIGKQYKHVVLGDTKLTCAEELQFLRIMVTSAGQMEAYRDSFDITFHQLRSHLADMGLGSKPAAISRGLAITVLPSVLFGCEILLRGKLQYECKHLAPLNKKLKAFIGLPATASNIAINILFDLPSYLAMATRWTPGVYTAQGTAVYTVLGAGRTVFFIELTKIL